LVLLVLTSTLQAFRWILSIHGGKFTNLVNGYLPVVALLALIIILPVIFQIVALKYERRKTRSDVQASMLGRYFYYQLATIYITVTAVRLAFPGWSRTHASLHIQGVLWKTLADILDHPSRVFTLFGESLPDMVGYFVALLVTKTLAGLPMIFLRCGALSRMLFLKMASNSSKLTQRELDAIYRQENVQYGWEFPTQLLAVVIVFTYAVICPIILPFGLLYFSGALMVYKKQILYVYRPVYESGGAMFPVSKLLLCFFVIAQLPNSTIDGRSACTPWPGLCTGDLCWLYIDQRMLLPAALPIPIATADAICDELLG
jgi:Calcium-dependent channel, 7TM region, putative phosphate